MLVAAHSPSVAIHGQAQAQAPSQTMQSQRRQLETAFVYQMHAVPTVPAAQNQPVVGGSQSPPTAFQFSLPVSVPVPAPVRIPAPVQEPTAERVSSPVQMSVEVPAQERLLAAQLAHYASQHHMSEYGKLKTERQSGQGQPVRYIPLSLHAPGQVRELRTRQAQNSEQETWWISKRSDPDPPDETICQTTQSNTEGQNATLPAMVTRPLSDISQEISTAISSQMTTHVAKTSESHPISISSIIPSEALHVLASQLTHPSITPPILFHLPESCHLDRLMAPRTTFPSNSFSRSSNPLYLPAVRHPISVRWSEQWSSDLENALNVELSLPSRPMYVPSQDRHGLRPPNGFSCIPALPFLAPTPPSPPRGVVRRRQRLARATSAPPALRTLKGIQRRASGLKESRQCPLRNRSSPETPTRRPDTVLDIVPSVVASAALVSMSPSQSVNGEKDELSNNKFTQGLMLPPSSTLPRQSPQATPAPMIDRTSTERPASTRWLGNLFLSSCPGKKVRLSGPVKGRAAICRDLRADLVRMKQMGAQCVICCLDDEELDYLGASWGEYSSIANDLGLDVLRIPMPEGLTPPSPAVLDSQLKRIIEEYTLRGVSVLAHCRGGVGRAGLVACCWMLKLGLLGWKDPQICASSCSKHSQCQDPCLTSPNFEPVFGQVPLSPQTHPSLPDSPRIPSQDQSSTCARPPPANVPRVCRATLHLLERVLSVVRRRRSLKAVETYEQVRFLVEFIEYLDDEARRVTGSAWR